MIAWDFGKKKVKLDCCKPVLLYAMLSLIFPPYCPLYTFTNIYHTRRIRGGPIPRWDRDWEVQDRDIFRDLTYMICTSAYSLMRVWQDVVSVLERLGLVSVSSCFWNVSVSRVWKNRTSRSLLGLEGGTSRSRLDLEDITSPSRVSGFVTLGLVNIHAMHQACGYIRKKIIDLTRKKQLVKWQTSPVC